MSFQAGEAPFLKVKCKYEAFSGIVGEISITNPEPPVEDFREAILIFC